MSAVQLRRIDPAANVRRFYVLQVQPDLFGGFALVREWGRIGQPGRVVTAPYPTAEAAEAALVEKRQAKERRGYGAT